MLATTKLVACLAAVSTLECKEFAQATDHHEGNNVPAPPPTAPETSIVQSTDSALLTTDEDRMLDFPHGIHPSRASRLPASPHADQAKLEDLQRVYHLEKEHPLIALSAENRPTFYHLTYPNEEEMMKEIKEMVWSDTPRWLIVEKIHSEMSFDGDKRNIEMAIDEAFGEYKIKLEQSTTKWLMEDESPEVVFERLEKPKQRSVKYDVYLDYKKAYYDHQARLGFEYATWFRRKTDPADVLRKLNEMFSGQGKMATKYHSEYKKLLEEYSDIMERMWKYLNDKRSPAFIKKWLQHEYKMLSDNTLGLLQLVYTSWTSEHKILSWMKEKKIPDEVLYALSRGNQRKGLTLQQSQNYLSFLIYRDWWIETFPDEAVELWMRQKKELYEVRVLLKLYSVPDSELSVHPMYPHFLKYRNWWIVTFPDKALESWKYEKLKLDDVTAVLKPLEEPDFLKMRPYYEDFANWLAAEQIDKRLKEGSS